MNAGEMITAESVYLVLRDCLGSQCPWTGPAALLHQVQDCSGPENCAFGRYCELCRRVAAFSEGQRRLIFGEIEELRWEIRANRGETVLKCSLCGVIKTAVSKGEEMCLHCTQKSQVSTKIEDLKAPKAIWTVEEALEVHICPRLGSQ